MIEIQIGLENSRNGNGQRNRNNLDLLGESKQAKNLELGKKTNVGRDGHNEKRLKKTIECHKTIEHV